MDQNNGLEDAVDGIRRRVEHLPDEERQLFSIAIRHCRQSGHCPSLEACEQILDRENIKPVITLIGKSVQSLNGILGFGVFFIASHLALQECLSMTS